VQFDEPDPDDRSRWGIRASTQRVSSTVGSHPLCLDVCCCNDRHAGLSVTTDPRSRGGLFKTALQVLAILCLIGLFSVIAHKAFADIVVLAHQHSGSDFWAALARHVFRNLSGG
jgi:hypothetical protein